MPNSALTVPPPLPHRRRATWFENPELALPAHLETRFAGLLAIVGGHANDVYVGVRLNDETVTQVAKRLGLRNPNQLNNYRWAIEGIEYGWRPTAPKVVAKALLGGRRLLAVPQQRGFYMDEELRQHLLQFCESLGAVPVVPGTADVVIPGGHMYFGVMAHSWQSCGILKIGFTKRNCVVRAREISSRGAAPEPLLIPRLFEVNGMHVEKEMHRLLRARGHQEWRQPNSSEEWFTAPMVGLRQFEELALALGARRVQAPHEQELVRMATEPCALFLAAGKDAGDICVAARAAMTDVPGMGTIARARTNWRRCRRVTDRHRNLRRGRRPVPWPPPRWLPAPPGG